MLIPSGSHVPGIDPQAFHLPPHTALRYERPADPLRRHVTSYVVMDSVEGKSAGAEWMLPGWAMIWIVITEQSIHVDIGNRKYAGLAPAVLYGVTSHAMPITARGGVTIGIDVSPLGWARLFGRSAESLRDQIVPLDQLLPTAVVEELSLAVMASDRSLGIKEVLDDFFLRHMTIPHGEEPRIAELLALIEGSSSIEFTTAALEKGINPRTAARTSRFFFGFPPKMLMMRTRFLRELVAMLDGEPGVASGAVPPAYYDQSHFTRDAKRFLGMTPRQFLAIKSPYAAAARRARRLVIGSPIAPLDRLSSAD
jgi:AraC-like DNA-binding protein